MAFYNPNGSGGVHVDTILTNISLGFDQGEFVGEKLFPVVPVKKQSDKYYVYDKSSWVPSESDYRAPGTIANEIPGLTLSTSPYYATEHALQVPVTDEERQNTDSPMSPDKDATELLTAKILLGREVAMRDLVTTVANYATGLSITLAGTTQFNDYANSDPITVFRNAMRAVHAKSFLLPNVAVIPYQVMSVLEDHPKILERIKYTRDGILTSELVASVLGIPRVIVPGVALGAGSGNNITASYLWGKDIILAYVPTKPGLKVPAFAYEFAWGYPQVMLIDRWREEPRRSDLIRCGRRYDLKMVGVDTSDGADNGKSITGYLIKNAIA